MGSVSFKSYPVLRQEFCFIKMIYLVELYVKFVLYFPSLL